VDHACTAASLSAAAIVLVKSVMDYRRQTNEALQENILLE